MAGFRLDPMATRPVRVASMPFSAPLEPLPGMGFAFQLGVSRRAVCAEIQRVVAEQPELPCSGPRDFRSGVLVYEGQRIVASLILPGNITAHGYELATARPGLGLGHRLLVEWCGRVRRLRMRPPQRITRRALRAWLRAHADLVRQAEARRLSVPRAVSFAVRAGEGEALLAELGGHDGG